MIFFYCSLYFFQIVTYWMKNTFCLSARCYSRRQICRNRTYEWKENLWILHHKNAIIFNEFLIVNSYNFIKQPLYYKLLQSYQTTTILSWYVSVFPLSNLKFPFGGFSFLFIEDIKGISPNFSRKSFQKMLWRKDFSLSKSIIWIGPSKWYNEWNE